MKKLALLMCLIFVSSAIFSVDIVTQSFETTSGYTPNPAFQNDGSNDYFDRGQDGDFGMVDLTGEDGLYYIGAEDTDADGMPGECTVTLDEINLSGYSSVQVSIALAAPRTDKYDEADYIILEYDKNNSGTYTILGAFYGHDWVNGDATNGDLREDTDLDGYANETGTILTSTFQDFTYNIDGDATTIDVRVRLKFNSGSEEVAFDNIRVTGNTSGNNPPVIANITNDPADPTSSDAVDVSADVTDSDGTITSVTCMWGTDGTTFPNNINMSTTRATYTTDSAIPAQTEGTTVYYKIQAVDDEPDTTLSSLNSFTIPYELTIYEIQGQTGNSPYDGEEVLTSGIVTGVYSSYFTIQDSSATWNGIWIKDSSPVALGDNVSIQGTVDEEYYLTIIKNATVTINSSGNSLPTVLTVATGSIPSEEYEGVLVKAASATCSDADLGYGEWAVDDGSGPCRVDDLGYAFTPTLGTLYNVTGPLYYSYNNFKIEPRDSSDVEDLGDNDAPTISGVLAMDDSTVIVYFNEAVEEITAETVGNYSITSRVVTISAAVRDSTDNTKVTLTVSGMSEGDYTLTAIGVEDLSGNASNDSENFTYVAPLGDGDLVVNEIMYNTPGYDNEWVELYNTTALAIDLEGFYLLDNDDLHPHLTIPAGYSIPAYGYFTIVIDTLSPPLDFTPDYDGGAGLWSLGNGGDAVRLYDSLDRLVDTVTYDDASPWPTTPDGHGPSLELIDPSYDNSLAASWQASFVDGGTPGAVNSTETLDTPTDLTITINGTDIQLNWTAVSGATGYNIYRSTDPYNFGSTVYDTSTTNSYTDTGAGVDTKYYYQITATN